MKEQTWMRWVTGVLWIAAAGCGESGGVATNFDNPDSDPDLVMDESFVTPEADEKTVGFDRVTLVEARFEGLEPLGTDFLYEGWLIVDGEPVSAGRFDITANTNAVSFELDGDLTRASLYVLTVEPRIGDDPAPSDVHVLAGDLGRGAASLTTAHPAALGVDVASSRGAFILETPTSAEAGDYDQGVWFVDPAAGAPSLHLPQLPAAWVYEGWVVTSEGPVSTGRFRYPAGADSDGAGSAAGPEPAPPFPGQDFIDPPLFLDGATIVVSVEPEPDDSPTPFAIKPLVGVAHRSAGPGGLQELAAGPAAPSGKVWLRGAKRNPRSPAVVVANRGSSSLSVLSASAGRLRRTVDLSEGSEPMYVSHDARRAEVLVGDRAHSQVLVLDDRTYALKEQIPVGRGVFHQWLSGCQLWVVADEDRAVSVVDRCGREARVETLPLPTELRSSELRPHDVFVDADRRAAFVTVTGPDVGYVVRYSTTNLRPTAIAEVGGDPHVAFDPRDNLLFVPTQDASTVWFLDGTTLKPRRSVGVPNAHGAYLERSRRVFFTTNIAGGGTGGIVAIDAATGRIRASLDTPFPTPHNLVGGYRDRSLFLTHSGSRADKVTVYARTAHGPRLALEVTTGLNPFGLAYVAPSPRSRL